MKNWHLKQFNLIFSNIQSCTKCALCLIYTHTESLTNHEILFSIFINIFLKSTKGALHEL